MRIPSAWVDAIVVDAEQRTSDDIPFDATLSGELGRIHQTIWHGTGGGSLLDGVLYGYARHASAMLDAPTQFDFCAGGGRLELAFLGFGECWTRWPSHLASSPT